MRRSTNIQVYLVGLAMCLGASPVLADSLPTQDREEINRLRSAQGHSAEEVAAFLSR